jgi:hypothetical protein
MLTPVHSVALVLRQYVLLTFPTPQMSAVRLALATTGPSLGGTVAGGHEHAGSEPIGSAPSDVPASAGLASRLGARDGLVSATLAPSGIP